MRAPDRQITIEISLSPEVSVAMKMLGLEGEKLAREMKQATALSLFKKGLLSIGKAAELADLCLADFADLLAGNQVAMVEYSSEDLQKDLEALAGLET